ncbi:MAG: DUF61 family protein [Candidatus Thorarchaeota archaeon]
MSLDDKLSKFLKHEIESVNLHLPKKRVSLEDAIQGKTYYMSREDVELYINKKEVDVLSKICPVRKHKDVFLPILIIRRRDLGKGVYVISGELIEQYLVLKALNKYDKEWDDFRKNPLPTNALFLYKPDLIEIRKILPTGIVIGFT